MFPKDNSSFNEPDFPTALLLKWTWSEPHLSHVPIVGFSFILAVTESYDYRIKYEIARVTNYYIFHSRVIYRVKSIVCRYCIDKYRRIYSRNVLTKSVRFSIARRSAPKSRKVLRTDLIWRHADTIIKLATALLEQQPSPVQCAPPLIYDTSKACHKNHIDTTTRGWNTEQRFPRLRCKTSLCRIRKPMSKA